MQYVIMPLMPTKNCHHNIWKHPNKRKIHIRVSNDRNDIKNAPPIEAWTHFNNWNHIFHKQGKFILIGQLNNIKNTPTEVLKQRLKDNWNYWIKRLKTLGPFGFNKPLNWVHDMQYFFHSPLFLPSAHRSNIWCKYHWVTSNNVTLILEIKKTTWILRTAGTVLTWFN